MCRVCNLTIAVCAPCVACCLKVCTPAPSAVIVSSTAYNSRIQDPRGSRQLLVLAHLYANTDAASLAMLRRALLRKQYGTEVQRIAQAAWLPGMLHRTLSTQCLRLRALPLHALTSTCRPLHCQLLFECRQPLPVQSQPWWPQAPWWRRAAMQRQMRWRRPLRRSGTKFPHRHQWCACLHAICDPSPHAGRSGRRHIYLSIMPDVCLVSLIKALHIC
jgi:hypothetical protein